MSGLKSRNKGVRGEYQLRDYLIKCGFTAHRVPLSGASQGFKGDVIAERNGVITTFELKTRKNAYKRLYQYLDLGNHNNVCLPGNLIRITYSLDTIFSRDDFFGVDSSNDKCRFCKKFWNRILRMKGLLGESDILVLKDDRKPFIFLRFL